MKRATFLVRKRGVKKTSSNGASAFLLLVLGSKGS